MSANPFVALNRSPRSRYRSLGQRDYIIMTLSRVRSARSNPQCINDHFWVMFLDPDYDLSVVYPAFLKMPATTAHAIEWQ